MAGAARVAELLKQELNVEAKIEAGGFGEFKVLVDGQVVAKKGWFFRPQNAAVVEAVRKAM